jgi:hypothetical protein
MILDSEAGDLDCRDAVAWYLGYDEPTDGDAEEAIAVALRKLTDTRLPLLLLALAAAIAEANVAAHGQRWRYSPAVTVRWLGFVTGLGYELTEAEREVLAEARAAGEAEPEVAVVAS